MAARERPAELSGGKPAPAAVARRDWPPGQMDGPNLAALLIPWSSGKGAGHGRAAERGWLLGGRRSRAPGRRGSHAPRGKMPSPWAARAPAAHVGASPSLEDSARPPWGGQGGPTPGVVVSVATSLNSPVFWQSDMLQLVRYVLKCLDSFAIAQWPPC